MITMIHTCIHMDFRYYVLHSMFSNLPNVVCSFIGVTRFVHIALQSYIFEKLILGIDPFLFALGLRP